MDSMGMIIVLLVAIALIIFLEINSNVYIISTTNIKNNLSIVVIIWLVKVKQLSKII